jgi:hypothetical protein
LVSIHRQGLFVIKVGLGLTFVLHIPLRDLHSGIILSLISLISHPNVLS